MDEGIKGVMVLFWLQMNAERTHEWTSASLVMDFCPLFQLSLACRPHRVCKCLRERTSLLTVRVCGVTGRGLKESRVHSFPQTDPKSSADTLKGHHSFFTLSLSLYIWDLCVCVCVCVWEEGHMRLPIFVFYSTLFIYIPCLHIQNTIKAIMQWNITTMKKKVFYLNTYTFFICSCDRKAEFTAGLQQYTINNNFSKL